MKKKQPHIFEVETSAEFKELIGGGDFRIRNAVVDSILGNINSRKKNIHLFSIACFEDDKLFEVTLNKSYFLNTLKFNLPFFEAQEMYEKCEEIKKVIADLSSRPAPPISKKSKEQKS